MPTNNDSGFGDDTLDIVGKALGFALAAYDQAPSNGGQFDRINATRNALNDLIDDEQFSDEVASVLDGLCAGITAYMQQALAQKTGSKTSSDYIL